MNSDNSRTRRRFGLPSEHSNSEVEDDDFEFNNSIKSTRAGKARG